MARSFFHKPTSSSKSCLKTFTAASRSTKSDPVSSAATGSCATTLQNSTFASLKGAVQNQLQRSENLIIFDHFFVKIALEFLLRFRYVSLRFTAPIEPVIQSSIFNS